jgi:peptidoglycan/LPS O-acetylase OafA/YrhL
MCARRHVARTLTHSSALSHRDSLGPTLILTSQVQEPLYSDNMYVKPYTRMAPYLIGLLLGFVLQKYPVARWRISNIQALFGHAVALTILGLTLYGVAGPADGNPWSQEVNDLYNSVSRMAWAIGLSWIVIACMTGKAGPVGSFLNAPGWLPLSRLTFGCYLLHPIVIVVFNYALSAELYLTVPVAIVLFLGFAVAANLFSTALYLGVESPVGTLLKRLLSM